MKKIYMFFLTLAVLLLCTSLVSAAVTVTSSYDKDHPTFGSSTTEASNPNEDDETIVPASVAVSNDAGSVTIDNILVTPVSPFDLNDLNITLDNSVSVPASGTASVNLKARIPENLDAVEDDSNSADYLKPLAFKVATVALREGTTTIVSFDVYMQRENKLQFKGNEVTLTISGDDKDYEDGDDTDEIMPGEDITFDATVENTYTSSADVQIEDVEVLFLLDDETDSSWDWDEVDESEDVGDIDADKEEDVSFTFSIDEEVEDYSKYDAEVQLSGEDEYGAFHGEMINLQLDIDRDDYDFVIKSASLDLSTLSCTRSTNLDLKVENLGKKGDDEVFVYVTNSNLGINYESGELELEEFGQDNDWSKSVSIVVPEDVKSGTYTVRVSVYYSGDEDDGVLADIKDVTLTVASCSSSEPDEEDEEEDEPIIINQPDVDVPSSVDDLPDDVKQDLGLVETTESSFLDSRAFDVILVAAVVIAFGSLIFLLSKLLML